MLTAASTLPAGWQVVLGLLGGGALASLLTVFVQQRNRNQDKHDAATVAGVGARQSEITSALDAWQKVSAANAQQLASMEGRLETALARAEKCENETVPTLRREVTDLQDGRAGHLLMIQELQAQVAALQGGKP